jgi:hypothetical protein
MRLGRTTIAVAALASCALAFAAEEKTNLPNLRSGIQAIMKDDETNAGSFDGTWMYVNRDSRFAMWIRTKEGKRQVRLQYQSLASPEAFETDWDGKSIYYMGGKPVTFELKLTDQNADKLSGSWSWVLKFDTSGRVETADVLLYRTAYGRTMQMDFNNYAKTLTRSGVDRTVKVPTSWSWMKVSKREVLWQEMPF